MSATKTETTDNTRFSAELKVSLAYGKIRWGNIESPDDVKETVNRYLDLHEKEFIEFVIKNGIYDNQEEVDRYIRGQVEKLLQNGRGN
ncbi:MAG TPA: hypothetical protein VJJ76_00595 [archaeon]|nr:hypothetical protein [archaeon]